MGQLGIAFALACSAFSGLLGQEPIVGKNFDWSDGRGFLVVNQRGREREALFDGARRWTAKHGSVSLTVAGPGFPVSGMNEAGLVFEALVDFDSPTRAPGSFTSLEWGQYVLDSFATVDEVVASLPGTTIAQMAVPLHFFVCDAARQCVIVEPRVDGLKVTRPDKLKPAVIANSGWARDRNAARKYEESNPLSRLLTPSWESHVRFATLSAAGRGEVLPDQKAVFELLDDARIRTMNRWQILWRQKAGVVTFRQRDDDGGEGKMHRMKLSEVSFACESGVQRVAPLAVGAKLKLRSFTGEDQRTVELRLTAMLGAGWRGLSARIAGQGGVVECRP